MLGTVEEAENPGWLAPASDGAPCRPESAPAAPRVRPPRHSRGGASKLLLCEHALRLDVLPDERVVLLPGHAARGQAPRIHRLLTRPGRAACPRTVWSPLPEASIESCGVQETHVCRIAPAFPPHQRLAPQSCLRGAMRLRDFARSGQDIALSGFKPLSRAWVAARLAAGGR